MKILNKVKDLYDRVKTRQLPCLSFTNPVSSSSSLLLSHMDQKIPDCQENFNLRNYDKHENDEEYAH